MEVHSHGSRPKSEARLGERAVHCARIPPVIDGRIGDRVSVRQGGFGIFKKNGKAERPHGGGGVIHPAIPFRIPSLRDAAPVHIRPPPEAVPLGGNRIVNHPSHDERSRSVQPGGQDEPGIDRIVEDGLVAPKVVVADHARRARHGDAQRGQLAIHRGVIARRKLRGHAANKCGGRDRRVGGNFERDASDDRNEADGCAAHDRLAVPVFRHRPPSARLKERAQRVS